MNPISPKLPLVGAFYHSHRSDMRTIRNSENHPSLSSVCVCGGVPISKDDPVVARCVQLRSRGRGLTIRRFDRLGIRVPVPWSLGDICHMEGTWWQVLSMDFSGESREENGSNHGEFLFRLWKIRDT